MYRILSFLRNAVQEEFYALYLDSKNGIIGYHQVAKGANTGANVSPADVLRPALLSNAVSIIVAHNHPSGDPTPSHNDRLITEKLKDAANLFEIKLLDHVVIGDSKHYSLISDQEFNTTEAA